MEGSVTNIILTSEYQEKGRVDYENLHTDVIVQFDNGDKYFAPFMSYKKLEEMRLLQRGNRLSILPVTREEFDYIKKLGLS